MNKQITIGLVGNPNCGKTTLFNALTGSTQRVGNWPGVTVERKSGFCTYKDTDIQIVDLPGTYSLSVISESGSVDERIATEYILSHQANVVINIVDASNLERNLFLTTQLLEMNVPVILAVNMMDVVKKQKTIIDLDALSKKLGCPVIAMAANKKKGLVELQETIYKVAGNPSKYKATPISFSNDIESAIANIESNIAQSYPEVQSPRCLAIRLLEDDVYAQAQVHTDLKTLTLSEQEKVSTALDEDLDILLADGRYSFIHELVKVAVDKGTKVQNKFTGLLDKIVLNRVLGLPIFLFVMYLMFLFAINVGGAFQDFFDIGSDTIFVQGLAHVLSLAHFPSWLTAILASGVGKGINTTITFIPVIGGMFLFLSFLEDSGYMARAAFVVDRFMRAIGLPGKSFVPMIVGFGCNVPAVMATRTLENKRDRILTIMMSPFMSCGARLAIFAVFTAAFFPKGGQNVIFALYLIGILAAIGTGLILRKTILKGDPSPLVMELPPYHIPSFRALKRHTWFRLKRFIFKAGRIIIPVCLLIGALNAINIDGTLNTGTASQNSVLSTIGKTVTPIFAPMGLQQDNWPATVGLVTGVLAKEVVIGTLNTLYTEQGHIQNAMQSFSFTQGLHDAVMSVPDNLANLKNSLGNPVLASAPEHSVTQGVYGQMYMVFGGQAAAFAYLLFILLYFPCISTTAVMLREMNKGWTALSMTWNTVLAYGAAVLFFQAATLYKHPESSSIWIGIVLATFLAIFIALKKTTLNDTPPPSKLAQGGSQ